MARRRAHELDAVELLKEVGGWPTGTVGAVVSEYDTTALVEVSTEDSTDAAGLPKRGLLDDLVSVPYRDLKVIEAAPAHAR